MFYIKYVWDLVCLFLRPMYSVQVTKCKPGEYERGTYFCGSCQTNSLESGPSTNSIIGWVTAGVRVLNILIFPSLVLLNVQ